MERYSDFDKFYNTLKVRYPHCIFPRLSLKGFKFNEDKTFLENKKFSTFEKISKFSAGTPKAEYLMNLKNSRDKLNLNIKKNLSRNLDFNFSHIEGVLTTNAPLSFQFIIGFC